MRSDPVAVIGTEFQNNASYSPILPCRRLLTLYMIVVIYGEVKA
jgi:hypothetical protein